MGLILYAKEDAGKCQYGAYDTTFVQHRRLADALLVQALAFFIHEQTTLFVDYSTIPQITYLWIHRRIYLLLFVNFYNQQ